MFACILDDTLVEGHQTFLSFRGIRDQQGKLEIMLMRKN